MSQFFENLFDDIMRVETLRQQHEQPTKQEQNHESHPR